MANRPAWRQNWSLQKSEIALRMTQGECGASYGEAMLVMCSAINAMAAEVWPGPRIDHHRFVELLVSLSDEPEVFQRVSVPLLVKKLHESQDLAGAATLRKAFLPLADSLVITTDVDRAEGDIQEILPGLDRAKIRRFSYANLLYEEVRSPYVHEYRPGENADSSAMTMEKNVAVSYGNWLGKERKGVVRRIFFHPEWLAKQIVALGARADAESRSFPRKPGA